MMRRLLVFFALASVAHANLNLIVNGSFEDGNSGFSTDFVYSPGDIYPPKVYDIVKNPADSHGNTASYTDHTGGGYMLAVNGSVESDDIAWSQTVQVQANTSYELSFWLSSWSSLDSPDVLLEIKINQDSIISNCNVPPIGGVWEEWNAVWFSGDSQLAVIDFVNTSTLYSGNDFALDDISFIPEPTTLLLLGLGGLVLRKNGQG